MLYEVITDSSIDLAEKELFHSVAKSHEMYNALLLLLLELKGFADKRIELRKDKKRPSEEDLNPNTRFVNNAFLLQLADNENLESSIRKNGAFWSNYPEVVKGLFTVVEESKLYIDYMAAETSSYAEDQRFIAKLMEKVIRITSYNVCYTKLLRECGLFLQKYPNLDMISFGPTIKGAHSPQRNNFV